MPLDPQLVNAQKGTLFEHAVILEILRRVRLKNLQCRVCFWRTKAGVEVDCVLDFGDHAIPIEIKSAAHVSHSDASGVSAFLREYPKTASHGYVVTDGAMPQKLSSAVTAVPWNML
jgi:predicted AAA+ superfamily ATPase